MGELYDIIVPIGFVGGVCWLISKIWKLGDNKYEEEPEEAEVDVPIAIEADTVAKQICTNRKAFVYNRLRGDLERVQHLQSELDKVEELITQTESFHFMNTSKLEKNLTITAPKYAGSTEMTTYNLDLYNNPHSREIALNLLYSERDRLATSLLEEVQNISQYAVTKTVTKTYDIDELRGVVNSVLERVKGA